MTYIRGKHLARRAVLRGLGLSVGLPFLDAMTPALAQVAASPRRMGVFYFPNGYISTEWTPTTAGRDYRITPSLEPIAPHRDKVSVITGLACDPSKTIIGFHDRAIASVFTGVERSKTEVRVGTSVDQIAAASLGKGTQIRSLELAAETATYRGGPSFATPTNQLPLETNPRALFERLFGDADTLDPAALKDLHDKRASILDVVAASTGDLKRDLGPADKIKLDEYLDSVRDIESRLNVPDKVAAQGIAMERPIGPPTAYPDLVKMMFDLQVIAVSTDKTRVWSFMMGDEATNMEFPQIDWNFSHHLTSHHGNKPDKMAGLAKINRHQVELFAYLLAKMEAVKEADGTLLDNSLLMYASSMGDASLHKQVDLPVLLCGGANMKVRGGSHVRLPDNTPITNLYLTMLDKVGVPTDKMGDSTGAMTGVSDV